MVSVASVCLSRGSRKNANPIHNHNPDPNHNPNFNLTLNWYN